MQPFVIGLIAHGLIGGADVIFNHELVARIPAQPNSSTEQCLHSARELIFGLLFGALAWFEWHGLTALAIVMLLIAEFAVSTIDTIIELDTRVLPVTERIAHVLLFINFGIVIALLGQVLLGWAALPTALVAADYGAASRILSALAVLAVGWSVRDAVNVVLRNLARVPA